SPRARSTSTVPRPRAGSCARSSGRMPIWCSGCRTSSRRSGRGCLRRVPRARAGCSRAAPPPRAAGAAPPPAGPAPPPAEPGPPTTPDEAVQSPPRPPRSPRPPRGPGRRENDRVRFGGSVTVAEGETIFGDAVAIGGTVRVDGVVTDNAVAIGGDLVLGPNADVRGDAVVVGG